MRIEVAQRQGGHVVLGIGRAARAVGRDDEVGRLQQGGGNHRLAIHHVETRAGDAARIEGGDQRVGVHQRAAGDVDEVALGAERGEHRLVDHVPRLGIRGRRYHQHVGRLGQGEGRLIIGVGRVGGLAAAVVADRHGEAGLAAAGDFPRDGAVADEAEAHAGEFGRRMTGLVPLALPHGMVLRGDAADGGEHQRQRVIGDRNGVGAGTVGHDDAAGDGRLHVDAVIADAEAGDHLELGHGVHLGGGHAGGAVGQDGAEVRPLGGDGRRALLGRRRIGHLEDGLEPRQFMGRKRNENEQLDGTRRHGAVLQEGRGEGWQAIALVHK